MEPALAARFPKIKAYAARGLDDTTATGRFELTPEGLHAMVISASGAFLVDVVGKNENGPYVSYFHSSLPADPFPVSCVAAGGARRTSRRERNELHQHGVTVASDSDLRTYRLAVAASHRYVNAIHNAINPGGSAGDLVGDALTAIHRTINRVNLIFRAELGVRFVLISKETDIIYPNEEDDPYFDNADPDDLLETNQINLDRVIGSDNYDVGHLFIANSGGVASQPCACNDWYKAQGLSGRPRPLGNAFDVNIVAHEIGHQFNASHSFNGTTKGCQYRNADTAYEPGSGSTIMSYASASQICGAETIQALSDPYFHAISLREINSYLTDINPGNGGSCPARTPTTNLNRPRVDAVDSYIIPKGTPFTLGVVSSSDGDGDALVYNWEEFDLGDPDPPQPKDPQDINKIRPLFRSVRWSRNSSRTFPAMARILNPPTIYVAEASPANNRTMIFRATARDNRGRYGYDDVQITVIAKQNRANVGPFTVAQLGSLSWRRGTTQTVRWSVAGTDLAPISCQLVRISLLINGDEAHPVVLVGSTLNNGSREITLPVSTPLTTMARVKVEAIGNAFFNVSPTNISIKP